MKGLLALWLLSACAATSGSVYVCSSRPCDVGYAWSGDRAELEQMVEGMCELASDVSLVVCVDDTGDCL